VKVLAIETTGATGGFAIVEGAGAAGPGAPRPETVAAIDRDIMGRHVEASVCMIAELLDGASLALADLDGVAVSLGPGSFTGLRVGLGVAKGLCVGAGLPLVGVPTLDCLARPLRGSTGLVVPARDARRGEIYCCMYRSDGGALERLSPYMSLAPEALLGEIGSAVEAGGGPVTLVGDALDRYGEVLGALVGDVQQVGRESRGRRRDRPGDVVGGRDARSGHGRAHIRAGVRSRTQARGAEVKEDRAAAGKRLAIRRMCEDDIDAVWSIERDLFPTPWPRRSFVFEVGNSRTSYAVVASEGGAVIGYAVGWFVGDELHIGNVAVRRDRQGSGIGRRLLEDLMREASARKVSYITLEVRASNVGAIGLYRRYGFKEIAIRKGYYTDNGEDALVMLAEVGGGEGGHGPATAV